MALAETRRRTTQGAFTGAWKFLYSWDFSETGGTSSVVLKLYDGTDNTGVPLTPAITVAAGTAVGQDFAHPRSIQSGSVFLEKSGSGTGEVLIGVA